MKNTLLAGFLLLSTAVSAQWECPSRIGGQLKPFSENLTNLTWASELTTSAGYAGEDAIANAMLFGALDYSNEKNTFYLEGGVKTWMRTDLADDHNEAYSLGLREAYYQHRGTDLTLNLGLRSTQGDDPYLLNERMLGADVQYRRGGWILRGLTGSVLDRFARNGTFCTLGFLYNIVPGRDRALIGQTPMQTNLAMLSLHFMPGKSGSSSSNDDDLGTGDGLTSGSDDLTAPSGEFTSADGLGGVASGEFAGQSATASWSKPVDLGAVLYTEYGSLVSTSFLLSGLYAEVEVAGLTVKPELLLQTSTGNQALLWNLTVQKQIVWSNQQQTKFFVRGIGYLALDSAAVPLNSFSNVFAGEVLRMDAIELPILQAGIKHSIPALKSSVKLQGAVQTGTPRGYTYNTWMSPPHNARMQEYDLVLTHNVGEHLLLNLHAGYLTYPKMTSAFDYATHRTPWGKLELRYTF